MSESELLQSIEQKLLNLHRMMNQMENSDSLIKTGMVIGEVKATIYGMWDQVSDFNEKMRK